MSAQEADGLTAAFKTGGAAAMRKALNGVKPTGTITHRNGKPVPTRLTIERPSDQGRMLTIVTDQPLVLIGAGLPDAKPTAGFDFGIVDFVIDASGNGTGTMSPAAKVTVRQGAFVTDEVLWRAHPPDGRQAVEMSDHRETRMAKLGISGRSGARAPPGRRQRETFTAAVS